MFFEDFLNNQFKVLKKSILEDCETEQPGTQTGTYFILHKYMPQVD